MYIHPFLSGVIMTVTVETIVMVLVAIWAKKYDK